MINKITFYKELNFTDAYLYKFGIKFQDIPKEEKQNSIDLSDYKPEIELIEIFKNIRKKSWRIYAKV